MAYEFTAEDFEAERNARSQRPTGDDRSLLDKAGDIAGKFNAAVERGPLPSLGAGVLQGATNAMISGLNVPLGIGEAVTGSPMKLPYADFHEYVSSQAPSSRAAFMAGEIGSPGAGGARLHKALSGMGRPSLAKNIASGTASGAAVSGSDDPMSRVGGGVLGAGFAAAGGLSNKAIASKIGERADSLEGRFNNEYKTLFKDAASAAPNNKTVRVPNNLRAENYDNIKPLMTGDKKFVDALRRFKDSPTIEHAHKAQSDLGGLIRKINDKTTRGSITSEEALKRSMAEDMQRRIRGSMQSHFMDIGHPELATRYQELTRSYADEMAPYLSREIRQYRAGKSRPKDVVNKTLRNERFMEPGGAYRDIPGMGTKSALYGDTVIGDLLAKSLQGAALGYGAKAAYEFGLPGLGGALNKAS